MCHTLGTYRTITKEDHEFAGVVSTLGTVIGQLSAKELQEQGILANLDVNILQLIDAHVGFNSYAQELKWLVTSPERIDFLSDMINNLSGSGNTLMLVDRIKTGQLLIEKNPDWVFISGEMKSADRKDEYKEVSKMDNKIIVATYGVEQTGINIPEFLI